MVRLSTEYDKELNSKIYYLRGDEAYARTTSTVLYLTAISSSDIEGREVAMSVTVLRDLGSGTITLKDGDVVLGVYDWDDTMNLQELDRFKFTWGVEHRLSAHYSGNAQSLSSHSKVKKVTYALPSAFKTQISLTGSSTAIASGGNATVTATLTINGEVTSNCYSQPILIYVDDTLKATLTTPSDSNTVSTTISGLNDGKHTISAVVEKSSTINSATKTSNLSVGYDIQWTEYSETAITGTTNTYKATVKNWFGNPIESVTAKLLPPNSNTAIATASTNSDGVATFTTTAPQSSMRIGYNGSYSETLAFEVVAPSGVSLIFSPYDTTYDGLRTDVIATVNSSKGIVAGVPVTFYNNNTSVATINTNAKGQAIYKYVADGSGEKIFKATSMGITSPNQSLKDCIVLIDNDTKRYNLIGNFFSPMSIMFSQTETGFSLINNSLESMEENWITFPSQTYDSRLNNCTIEFTVTTDGYIGTERGETMLFSPRQVKSGDIIRIEWRNENATIYRRRGTSTVSYFETASSVNENPYLYFNATDLSYFGLKNFSILLE